MDEIIGEWKMFHNKELCDIYFTLRTVGAAQTILTINKCFLWDTSCKVPLGGSKRNCQVVLSEDYHNCVK